MQIDMEAYVTVGGKYRLYNCTPHSVNVQVGEKIVSLPPCGATLRATETAQVVEEPEQFKGSGITFTKKVYKASEEGLAEINYIVGNSPKPVMLLVSFIAMQAYAMHPVVGIELVDPAMTKLPPEQRVISSERFQLS